MVPGRHRVLMFGLALSSPRPLLPEVDAFIRSASSCGIAPNNDYNGPIQTGVMFLCFYVLVFSQEKGS